MTSLQPKPPCLYSRAKAPRATPATANNEPPTAFPAFVVDVVEALPLVVFEAAWVAWLLVERVAGLVMGVLVEAEAGEEAAVVIKVDGLPEATDESTVLVSLAGSWVVLPASEVEMALVITTSAVVPALPAGVEVVTGTAFDGVKHERYEIGSLRIVPEYRGQPGTSVLGGARPPPQSLGSQIWPSFRSYQWTMPSSHVVKL
jgi:hypothetical protein